MTTLPAYSFTPKISKKTQEIWGAMDAHKKLYSEKELKVPCVKSWKRMEVTTLASSLSPLKPHNFTNKISVKPVKPFLKRQEEY